MQGQKIRVPLVASYRGSQLQRHLAAVNEAFKPTQLVDEAVALLVCVTLLPPEEAKAQEQAWMLEEEAENSGFIDSYRMLRDEFNPESCTTATDRSALAERIIEFARGALYASTVKNVHVAEELYWDLPEKNPHVFWPSLLGEEVNCGLPQLCVRLTHNFAREKVAARISIPEAIQWLMALFSFLNDEKRNFTIKDAAWRDYVGFFLESGEDIAYARITSIPTAYLQTLVHLGIKKPDGSELSRF